MEFGRVTPKELEKLSLHLPADPAGNKTILQPGGKKVKAWLGTSKWGRKEWVGKLYPKGTRDSQFLREYVKHFNAIELNATHYRMYKPEEIANWAEKATGNDFKFCPKVTNSISHYSGFNDAEAATKAFIDGIVVFGDQLGPVLLQVSEKYSPAQREPLFRYLQSWPPDVVLFLELRHPDWYNNKAVYNELLSTLQQLKMGLAITDTAGRRDVVHMNLTIPKAFIRFAGNSLHASDYTRIDEWAGRLKNWIDLGLEELYFFIQMPDEALTPELAQYTIEKFNKVCGLKLPEIKFIG